MLLITLAARPLSIKGPSRAVAVVGAFLTVSDILSKSKLISHRRLRQAYLANGNASTMFSWRRAPLHPDDTDEDEDEDAAVERGARLPVLVNELLLLRLTGTDEGAKRREATAAGVWDRLGGIVCYSSQARTPRSTGVGKKKKIENYLIHISTVT